MKRVILSKYMRFIAIILFISVISGCNMVVMNPSGDVANQQAQLIIYSTVLMLIVILPVMAFTVFFAFKYRASNKDATYDPEWDHSISLEIVIWSVPLAIIICLAGLTWVATHRLEPYNPLKRIGENRPVPVGTKPLVIQAVAMDWKWLFIYPEQGIATINEVAGIVDRPIKFELTSSRVMNSMYIPALAGQIYAMPGMQTELNAVINKPGTYKGFSANYSGEGFSKMRFKFIGMSKEGFADWVSKVREKGKSLDRKELARLGKRTIAHSVTYYQVKEEKLWDRIVNLCIDDDKLCKHDMMLVDALGGGGLEGLWNRQMFKDICSIDDPMSLIALVRSEKRSKLKEVLSAVKKKREDVLEIR